MLLAVPIFLLSALFGGDFSLPFGLSIFKTKRKSTNQRTAEGVSSETVRNLTLEPSSVESRVLSYLSLREQQDLSDSGAQTCQECGSLYVPVREKSWTMAGYCSKACAANSQTSP